MMPSRGLIHIARPKVPRLLQQQSRNLSSTPRPHLRSVSQRASTLSRTSQPWTRSIPATIPSIAALRHASTAQPQPAAQTAQATNAAPATPAPTETNSFPNLDTITLDDIDLAKTTADIPNIPEGIGYLHQIGIDYGMGPTSMIQWIFEHLHIYGGLPWWASIFCTAVSLRVIAFPMFLRASDSSARQTALASVTKPISDRMTAAQRAGNTQEVMIAWRQMGMIKKRAGISTTAIMAPALFQGVLAYCGYKLMHACAVLPVPGFHDGGFLWLQDLTITDGYLLLPAIMAGVVHSVVRFGGETGAAQMGQFPDGLRKVMLWGMPVMVFGFTAYQPAAVAIWFASSGLIGITQGQLLQRKAVRDFFGLAPLYKPKPGETQGGFMEGMLKGLDRDLQTKGKPTQAPSSSGAGGKNAAYMSPTYQSPNITKHKTVDTTLVNKDSTSSSPASASASDMIQPGAPAEKPKSVFGGVSQVWTNAKQKARNLQKNQEQTPEDKRKAERKAYLKRAKEYEERAQKRGGK